MGLSALWSALLSQVVVGADGNPPSLIGNPPWLAGCPGLLVADIAVVGLPFRVWLLLLLLRTFRFVIGWLCWQSSQLEG
jgi:hypothetical protein